MHYLVDMLLKKRNNKRFGIISNQRVKVQTPAGAFKNWKPKSQNKRLTRCHLFYEVCVSFFSFVAGQLQTAKNKGVIITLIINNIKDMHVRLYKRYSR